MSQKFGFDTLMTHAGYNGDVQTHSSTLPIYPTTAYQFGSAKHAQTLFELKEGGNIYSRLQNPTNDIFTFGIKGTRETSAKFIDSLKMILHGANVGDVRTLVIHPATTTHNQLSDEQLVMSGITPQTIRLSIGIEDVGDIIADLDQAICTAVGK